MRSTQLQDAQSRDVQTLFRGVPFGQAEFVDMVFPIADSPVRIRHNLSASPLTEVGYIVVSKNKTLDIYSADLSLWDQRHIVLCSTENDSIVSLLIFTRRL